MDSDEDDEEPQTSLEPLQTLNLLHQYFFIITDKQQILKNQLSLKTLRMKTVSEAMTIVHKIRILEGQ